MDKQGNVLLMEADVVTGIHHISIIASGEASVDFYTELGFQENKRIIRDHDTVVLMDGHGIGLEIFIDPRHKRVKEEPLGFRTLSLKVDSLDGDMLTDWNGERYVNIIDPDGNVIQLHE